MSIDGLKKHVDSEITIIESDSRFNQPDANVLVNDALALIQVDLKSRHRTLKEVREYISALIKVGQPVTQLPPHKSQRAELPH